MIRDEVLFYATIALLAFLAFFLMPTYERMTDSIEANPRNKAATSPTTAVTPQTAYPSKAAFGPSHISPILSHKASEEPMRPKFPPFEQFTTQKDIIAAKSDVGTTKGSSNMLKTDALHQPGRGDLYELPTVTSANTPALSDSAPATQTSGGVGASPPPTPAPSSGFHQDTLAAPSPTTGGSSAPNDPLNQYVLKSSLVPYTCPTGGCGAPTQLPSSKYPGDMDMPDYTRMKPNQKNIGRPYSEAFKQQSDEPQPFLTDFAPFTK